MDGRCCRYTIAARGRGRRASQSSCAQCWGGGAVYSISIAGCARCGNVAALWRHERCCRSHRVFLPLPRRASSSRPHSACSAVLCAPCTNSTLRQTIKQNSRRGNLTVEIASCYGSLSTGTQKRVEGQPNRTRRQLWHQWDDQRVKFAGSFHIYKRLWKQEIFNKNNNVDW